MPVFTPCGKIGWVRIGVMPISKEVLDEIALSEAEYQLIVQRLGKAPLEQMGPMWRNGLERMLKGASQ